MLAQSLVLAFLSSLAVALPVLVWSGDWLWSVRLGSVPACVALVLGVGMQWNVARAVAQGQIDRAKLVPWRPVTTIDQPPPLPVVSPVSTLQTAQTAPRSVVFNANGHSGQLTIEPASSGLVAFLDTCIRISAADKTVFPSVLDLKHIGIPYADYDNYLALLGDAVERPQRRPATIRNGYTLGDLRKMASGG